MREKKVDFLVNTAYILVLTIAAWFCLKYLVPILIPFILAFCIASILTKPIGWISNKTRISWQIAAFLCVFLFFTSFGSLLTIAVIKIVSAMTAFAKQVPELYNTYALPLLLSTLSGVENNLLELDPSLVAVVENMSDTLISTLGGLVSSGSVKIVSWLSSMATSLPGLFVNIIVAIISTFFVAVDYKKMTGFVVNKIPEKFLTILLEIKQYVVGTLFVCIRSYAIIMFITFCELTIAFLIIGLPYPTLIALCISIFDILPVLGTGGIMIPWIIIAALQGDPVLSMGLLITYIVVTVIRNIIEPKIVGKQLGLHPVVTLASMLVGAKFLGVIGLFGLPIGISLGSYLISQSPHG